MKEHYNAAQVKQHALENLELIISALYGGVETSGKTNLRFGNITGDRGSSFSIELAGSNRGMYIDHADPGVRGDIIKLIIEKTGKSFTEAIQWIANLIGIMPDMVSTKRDIEKKFTGIPFNEWKPIYSDDLKTYLKGIRSLDPELCINLGVVEHVANKGVIGFPHIVDGQCAFLQKRDLTRPSGKAKWFCQKTSVFPLFLSDKVTPDLTGGTLIITEGHWDALSWWQAGMPAVSIPNGANNHQWIEDNWEYIAQFSQILINFDNDEVGTEACEVAIKRLGQERCKILVFPNYKDCNEALIANNLAEIAETLAHPRDWRPNRLRQPLDFKAGVMNYLENKIEGYPCFDMPFKFRRGEITLWTGRTGHGKSTLLSQVLCSHIKYGLRSCIISLEQPGDMTTGNLLRQLCGALRPQDEPFFMDAYRVLNDHILIDDVRGTTSVKDALDVFRYAVQRYGVYHCVLDNVMMTDVNNTDNGDQADTSKMFAAFADEMRIHFHAVVHPRKPGPSDDFKRPTIYDVKGASEWVNAAWNVIGVCRHEWKKARLDSMARKKEPFEDIESYRRHTPDGAIYVMKQRLTGDTPDHEFFFHKDSKQAVPAFDSQPYSYFADFMAEQNNPNE